MRRKDESYKLIINMDSEDSPGAERMAFYPTKASRPPSVRGSSFRLSCRQFLLLLWKGVVLLKRHWIVTIIELLIPLLLVSVFVWARSLMFDRGEDTKHPPTTYDVYDPLANSYSNYHSDKLVLFTPNNSFTQTITSEAVHKLFRSQRYQRDATLMGVSNEEGLYEYAVHSKGSNYRMVMGVVYEGLQDSSDVPSDLRYKIRLKQGFHTTHTFNSFSMGGPSRLDYPYKEVFLGLQAAIDRTFLEIKTKNSTELQNTKIRLQPFPYPSFYSKSMIELYLGFLSMVIIFGLIVMMAVFVKRIVDEKANRAKEMMRMMGLSDLVYFGGTFFNTFILLAIIMTVTTILFKIPVSLDKQSVVYHSDGFLIWVILHLFAANALLFCMAFSAFFNKAVVSAIATILLWMISYCVPRFLLDPPAMDTYDSLKRGPKLASSLLPTTALHWAFRVVSVREGMGVGVNWSNMFEVTKGDNVSLAAIMAMMLASCALSIFVLWYVDNVWPWQPGIPKQPWFLFTRSYWCPGVTVVKNYNEFYDSFADKSYFEEEPTDKSAGITLSHMTKVFGSGGSRKVAVNDASLNMYKGQITVLLGHNGAGKTTTMNVMTGLYNPSSGTAVINGYNILEDLKGARSSLGLCPQHNVLYDNLTVEEHLKFFAGLKGRPFSAMQKEVDSYLEMLQLQVKRNDFARTLSGGMKRKLSLGIAMIGGSEVLILDEPTSGMDPQARRVIWDILQRIRADRTIVLTTHYMEEADILGDRIAIMAEGAVQCCGSPLFLKRKFGAGYHLRVSKGELFNERNLTSCVQQSVPTAYIESDMATEVSYILPVTDAEPFIKMFQVLEEKRPDIGYTACGLTVTTMEDVFIKVGQLAEKAQDTDLTSDPDTGSAGFETQKGFHLLGASLWFQQFRGLLLKRIHDSRRCWIFLIFLILLPLAVIIAMLSIRNVINSAIFDKVEPLKLDLQSLFGPTEAFYGGNDTANPLLPAFQATLKSFGAEPIKSDNVTASILNVGEKDFQRYKFNILVSGKVDKSKDNVTLTAMYSNQAYHMSAMALNLANVAVLRALTGNAKATITVINSPLPTSSGGGQESGDDLVGEEMVVDMVNKLVFVTFLPLALSFLSASFVLFPIHERMSKSKLLQLMTGVGGTTFWAAHFIWDFAMYFISSCFILIPFVVMDNRAAFSSETGATGILFVMLLLYGWSTIPLSYLLSSFNKKPSNGFMVVAAFNFITGLIMSTAITLLTAAGGHLKAKGEAIAWALRLLPSFTMTVGTANLNSAASHNVFCSRLDSFLLEYVCQKDSPVSSHTRCCPDKCGDHCFEKRALVSMEGNSCGRDMIFMFMMGLVFFFLLALLESKFFRHLLGSWDRYRTRNQPPILKEFAGEDSDVVKEKCRVEDLYERGHSSEEALVAYNLTKYFGNVNAVDHLTFSVHQDECFGLLGVNGAGKTTTFSMLTGDMILGAGDAQIGDYSVKNHLNQYQVHVGYCPQFDAILERLTGRESLYLFARLRGVPEGDIPATVTKLIEVVDLQAHADKSAEKYSGGNRRKLSLAMSLVGSPPVVFLDEPTSGVDPASRRKIWTALARVQATGGTSFILTTHSMEECEALCSRLAIMVNGQFRCLGGIQYLKTKFGQGYTIIVKLQRDNFSDNEATEAVKTFFQNTFPGCTLKDVHQGMLHYHIEDARFSWSHLFREMEGAKLTFDLEDYLISDTTLEQIFLAFARTQRVVAT